jgi:hypothetical protein
MSGENAKSASSAESTSKADEKAGSFHIEMLIAAKYGESAQDTAMINIRYHLRDNDKMVGEKVWLPPKEWARQEDAAEYITFKSGDVFDFIYVGEWADDGPINNRDYSDVGGFYNFMNKEHDFVFAISSVGGPYTVIPHFEILCR